jgi:antitoxin component of MazEF toxin-antitoxin module
MTNQTIEKSTEAASGTPLSLDSFCTLINIRANFKITLPQELAEELRLSVGHLLEATIDNGRLVLTPKVIVDRETGNTGKHAIVTSEPTIHDGARPSSPETHADMPASPTVASGPTRRPKRPMSEYVRAKISRAQTTRWTRIKAGLPSTPRDYPRDFLPPVPCTTPQEWAEALREYERTKKKDEVVDSNDL